MVLILILIPKCILNHTEYCALIDCSIPAMMVMTMMTTGGLQRYPLLLIKYKVRYYLNFPIGAKPVLGNSGANLKGPSLGQCSKRILP
jgi:hypothetical protein